MMMYQVNFVQHDFAAADHEIGDLIGKPFFDGVARVFQADTARYNGQFAKARELSQHAVDSLRVDEKETAAAAQAEGAVQEALVGNMSLAKQEANAALQLSNGRDASWLSALALALAGDSGQATRLAGDLAKRFPEDTIMQTQYLPMIRAATALSAGNPENAIQALAPAAPYELGENRASMSLGAIYLRGLAYVAAKQGASGRGRVSENSRSPWDCCKRADRCTGAPRTWPRLRALRRQGEGGSRLPGFPCVVERCRSGYSHPEGS